MSLSMSRSVSSRILAPLLLCSLLAACASQPSSGGGSSSAPASSGAYKVGKPYQINGTWYYPHEDYSYDETGVASWYGAENQGQRTSNGEIFNKNELTAAHRTLPMPTLARVTNLDNGRSIVVRINDRGPYSSGRIIDMSERASQLLGFEAVGTAKVRVQVLADESKAIADAMRHYGGAATVAESTPAPEQTASAALPPAVESQVLKPLQSTPETHRQLLATKPVAQAVQLPVTGGTRLYVQAGAFSVADNATKLQQSLTKLSPSTISTIVINGTKFYRVRLGPVSDVAHADALLSKVKQAGASAARTIVD